LVVVNPKIQMVGVTPEPIDPDERRDYERVLLGGIGSDTILQLLHHAGISQQELADRLGLSQPRISKLLRSENMTLQMLADLGWGLGVRFELRPIALEPDATRAVDDPPLPEWVARPHARRRRR
jgi:DNA-binding Xre family transcriptional regulator